MKRAPRVALFARLVALLAALAGLLAWAPLALSLSLALTAGCDVERTLRELELDTNGSAAPPATAKPDTKESRSERRAREKAEEEARAAASASASASAKTRDAAPRPAPAPTSAKGTRKLPFSDAARVTEINATLDLIEKGGPFPHKQDGTVFQNREGRLPTQPRGFYKEYTVRTPGLSNRGPRRIVQGRDGKTWYTDDHYKTFVEIDPRRVE